MTAPQPQLQFSFDLGLDEPPQVPPPPKVAPRYLSEIAKEQVDIEYAATCETLKKEFGINPALPGWFGLVQIRMERALGLPSGAMLRYSRAG